MLKLPNVIVEGLGGSGKSTIVGFLETFYKENNQPYILHHFEYPKGDNVDQKYGYQYGQYALCFDWIKKLNDQGIAIILDRSWIEEKIWSPLYRGVYPKYLDPLEKQLNTDFIILFADAKPKVILNRLLERNADLIKDDPYFNLFPSLTPIQIIEKLLHMFISTCTDSPINKKSLFMIDTNKKFGKSQKENIINILKPNKK